MIQNIISMINNHYFCWRKSKANHQRRFNFLFLPHSNQYSLNTTNNIIPNKNMTTQRNLAHCEATGQKHWATVILSNIIVPHANGWICWCLCRWATVHMIMQCKRHVRSAWSLSVSLNYFHHYSHSHLTKILIMCCIANIFFISQMAT